MKLNWFFVVKLDAQSVGLFLLVYFTNKSYLKPTCFKNNTIFKPLFQLSLNPILKDVIRRAI
jgi:hypothetical protein